jgi:Radical SAM superfamily
MRSIRELFVYPLSGLYHECHRIDYQGLATPEPLAATGKFCLRQVNDLWWHEILSRESIREITTRLANRYRVIRPDSPQHRAILANPDAFFEEVQIATRLVANLGAGARQYFRALETLQMFCSLYSDFISSPISLSLQEGLVLNELSSLLLSQEALNPITNPYLPFIEREIVPIVESSKPELLWLVGPIKMSTFAVALVTRKLFPTCHICVTGHATEYYSLNKITEFLKQNSVLFSVIDSIILDDFENTEPQLVECLRGEHDLNSVPNLLFSRLKERSTVNPSMKPSLTVSLRKFNTDIMQTPMSGGKQTLEFHSHDHPVSIPKVERSPRSVDPSEVVDARLWPNAKCYWDNCNFCAINRKYQTLGPNSFGDVKEVADYMASLSARGVRYVWSFDEAIPPKALGELARELIERQVDILWQTRSKIDRSFTPEICNLLGRSGLREIRLGLESASIRVLSAMGKFPSGWSLDFVEQIVSQFHSAGVSVHFPTIIGFPTETEAERAETFQFLRHISNVYPSVTFNMNVLGFDVASPLYENFEQHGITAIRYPAPAKYFLGNLVDWDCAEVPFDYFQCDHQRNSLMRQLLYPWLPSTALIPAYIFYRLAETSRATMVWKAQRQAANNWKDAIDPFDREGRFVTVGRLVRCSDTARSSTFIYDWNTHHNFETDARGVALLETLREPRTLKELALACGMPESELVAEIEQLYLMGIVTDADFLAPSAMDSLSTADETAVCYRVEIGAHYDL